MNKWFFLLGLSLVAHGQESGEVFLQQENNIYAQQEEPEQPSKEEAFNHSGVQRGAMIWSCYEECHVLKVLDFQQLQQSPDQSLIELHLLRGEAISQNDDVKWTGDDYRIFITCSKRVPSVALEGENVILPLSPTSTVPMKYSVYANLYWQSCHHFAGENEEAVERYHYDVTLP